MKEATPVGWCHSREGLSSACTGAEGGVPCPSIVHVAVRTTWGSGSPQCILVPCGPRASTRTRHPHNVDHLLPLLRGPVLKPRCLSAVSSVGRGQSGRPDWSAAPSPTHWNARSTRTRLGFLSRWSNRSSPVAFGPHPSGRSDRRRLLNLLRCLELPDISANWQKRVDVVLSVLAGSIEAFQAEKPALVGRFGTEVL